MSWGRGKQGGLCNFDTYKIDKSITGILFFMAILLDYALHLLTKILPTPELKEHRWPSFSVMAIYRVSHIALFFFLKGSYNKTMGCFDLHRWVLYSRGIKGFNKTPICDIKLP